MGRLAIATLGLFLFIAAFHRLNLLYSHKFFDVTGRAQWIWPQLRVAANVPVAFFATRDFDLPKNRYFTRIKIAGDPQYTLYFNGREVGGRRTADDMALDVYDVSTLARDGRNRIVVAVRSANGVGGLLASVDITPEYQNMVPSGSDAAVSRVGSLAIAGSANAWTGKLDMTNNAVIIDYDENQTSPESAVHSLIKRGYNGLPAPLRIPYAALIIGAVEAEAVLRHLVTLRPHHGRDTRQSRTAGPSRHPVHRAELVDQKTHPRNRPEPRLSDVLRF